MTNEERLSVHICTRNRNDYLAGLLASLYYQTFQDFDVIIVEDCGNQPVMN